MSRTDVLVMRDVFLEDLHRRMGSEKDIFILSADFGSPRLDVIRRDFGDRFVNVGIAEQNLVNVATGLAFEGFKVYAYAIAPFLVMRAYEQIRINVSLHAQLIDFNLNLIGVGAGLSYDVSGPTHHCIEDLIILKALPNIMIISPSDWALARKLAGYTLSVNRPKYLRFDGKGLPRIYDDVESLRIEDGFSTLASGGGDGGVCIVSTGYMTHKALKAAAALRDEGINTGVIDVFMLRPLDTTRLLDELKKYGGVITLEEGFINKGGLDTVVSSLLHEGAPEIRFRRMGFGDMYRFDIGGREYLHSLNKVGLEDVKEAVRSLLKKGLIEYGGYSNHKSR